MANALFVNYKNLILGAGTHTLPDWDTDTLAVFLIDSADHTVNLSTDIDEADITGAAIVAETALAGETISAGAVDATDTTFSSVTGDSAENILISKNNGGTASTSPLMVFFDTATGLPVTPNSGNIIVQWNASGIIGF